MNEFIDIVTNQSFAIAVAVYLLWERTGERKRLNQSISSMLEKIAVTLDERLPRLNSGGVS